MPSTKEMLLNILKNAKNNSLTSFQNECLEMFRKKVAAIPVDEKREMDLHMSGVLLDRCFCDLDNIFPSEQRIISLLTKDNLTDESFFENVNQIFSNELLNINNLISDTFFNQSLKNVKSIILDMKTELRRMKDTADHQLNDRDNQNPAVNYY